MRLWTYHGSGFSLTDGNVDWAHSEYHNDPQLPLAPAAYSELAKILGTDQYIWCCVGPETHWRNRIEYVLEVPDENFLAVVDSLIWNKIFGQKCAAPQSLKAHWLQQALEQSCGDDAKRDALYEQYQDEYDKPVTREILWKQCHQTCSLTS